MTTTPSPVADIDDIHAAQRKTLLTRILRGELNEFSLLLIRIVIRTRDFADVDQFLSEPQPIDELARIQLAATILLEGHHFIPETRELALRVIGGAIYRSDLRLPPSMHERIVELVQFLIETAPDARRILTEPMR